MNTHSHTHTPGPWTATGHDGKQCVIIECTWGSVAKVLPVGAQDQETANAQLIAAAPELLAALKFCLTWVETFDRQTGPKSSEGPLFTSINQARAAITKAEGVK